MQLYFYFDQSMCISCNTCRVACKDYNGVGPGPVSWRKVTSVESGRGSSLKVYNMSVSCNHCSEPACVKACPQGAISKDENTGAVIINRKICVNILDCIGACPYGAISVASQPQEKPLLDHPWRHPAQKCHMCHERLETGKKTTCVDACIMRALDIGTKQELEAKYGPLATEAPGFTYKNTRPNILFKPK